MARRDAKRAKEKRSKRAAHQRLESARGQDAEVELLREEARQRGLDIVTFEITLEPMADPLLDSLPEADRAEIERIGPEVVQNAAPHRKLLETLVAKHPHVPLLWNWFMQSVGKDGDRERADQLAEEIFRRFPTYLFGVAQWVMTLLEQDRLEDATRVLDGRLGLLAWWPERRMYHATEFVVFNAMLGCYFLATDNRNAAELQLEMITDILPDHPAVGVLESKILLDVLRQLAEGGAGAFAPRLGSRRSPAARKMGTAGAG